MSYLPIVHIVGHAPRDCWCILVSTKLNSVAQCYYLRLSIKQHVVVIWIIGLGLQPVTCLVFLRKKDATSESKKAVIQHTEEGRNSHTKHSGVHCTHRASQPINFVHQIWTLSLTSSIAEEDNLVKYWNVCALREVVLWIKQVMKNPKICELISLMSCFYGGWKLISLQGYILKDYRWASTTEASSEGTVPRKTILRAPSAKLQISIFLK